MGRYKMALIFEAIMVICFGLSWPISIMKSVRSRTAKGKSILFMCLILVGYVFGIVSKIMMDKLTYVFIFYVINFFMVFTDICIYFRNSKLDKQRDMECRAVCEEKIAEA